MLPVVARPVRWGFIACGALFLGMLLGWSAYWALHYFQTKGWLIEWSAMTTFATGVMAVGAALIVGRRQTEIQAKQVTIQERQTAIQLLDRRAEAIKSLSAFYRDNLSPHTPVEIADWNKAFDTLNQARLVYPEILTDLFEICLQNLSLCKAYKETASDLRKGGDRREAMEHDLKSNELFTTLLVDFEKLLKGMIAHARVDL